MVNLESQKTAISQVPVYNLGAVLKETGIQADVLRAWERRYKLPMPKRTAGGHRLYSEYDVAIIKWLRARQSEGLSISRAASLWKEIRQSGIDPLREISSLQQKETQDVEYNDQIDLLRASWLDACLAFDGIKAEEIINQSFALYPVETVCLEILQKGISQVGELWYQNKASVQQEHFATAMAIRRIESLITSSPNPILPQVIVTGCPAGEEHTFPLLMMTLLLRRKGLNVIYLGADIPLSQMEQAASSIRPTLIILAAQRLCAAASIRSAAILFQKLGFPLGYGGQIFNDLPELRQGIPAHFLGESIALTMDNIDRMVINPQVFKGKSRESQLLVLSSQFQLKSPLIEMQIIETLKKDGTYSPYFVDINRFFTSDLIAAFEFGNLDLMRSNLEWVTALLFNRGMDKNGLQHYLDTYQQAAEKVLGVTSKPLTEWLSLYVQEIINN